MKVLENEIEKLKTELIEMHGIAREAIQLCFRAMRGERDIVKKISRLESMGDELELKIHDHSASILIRFHPLARDFRFTLSAMRMSSAYERILDLVQEISLYDCKFKDKIFEAEKALLKMFDLITEGYNDSEKLKALSKLDDIVDNAYIETMEEIEKECSTAEEVLAARYIERIGDLLCKIATRLFYAIEGKWIWIR
ncbi:MAG: PhoU domain-containing protein [Archaeoglobaceae archaeon]|nr:PhoU domain-containing protein [Archaeoglobaceae archaeon]